MKKETKNQYLNQLSIYYKQRYVQEAKEDINFVKNKYNIRICKSKNNNIYKVSIDNFEVSHTIYSAKGFLNIFKFCGLVFSPENGFYVQADMLIMFRKICLQHGIIILEVEDIKPKTFFKHYLSLKYSLDDKAFITNSKYVDVNNEKPKCQRNNFLKRVGYFGVVKEEELLDFVFYAMFSDNIQVNFENLNIERSIDPILNVNNGDTCDTLLTETPGILDRVRNSQSDYERVDEFVVNYEFITKYLKKEQNEKTVKKAPQNNPRYPQISEQEKELKKKKENLKRMNRIAKWEGIFTSCSKKIKLKENSENLDETYSDNSYQEDVSDFESLDSFALDSDLEVREEPSSDENFDKRNVKKNQLTLRKESKEKKDENERKELEYSKAMEKECDSENIKKELEELIVADISLETKAEILKEDPKEGEAERVE
jgi:hypothetical protein